MLVFHSHCQTGNQMFIYACARSIAKKRKVSYCISHLNELKYFKLSTKDYVLNRIFYLYFKLKNLFIKFEFCHFQDNLIDYSNTMLFQEKTNVWYYGYFQSEKYLYENFKDIKKVFQPKNKYVKQYQNLASEFKKHKDIVVIHVRLTDYANSGRAENGGKDMRLPFHYYHKLIDKFICNSNFFIFLSDDIEKVKNEFSYLENAYFSENSAIIDFQFLLNSKILIIGPSSFAWWAAWLNKNNDKKVYVPDFWLGHKVDREYPINIIPKNWIKVRANTDKK